MVKKTYLLDTNIVIKIWREYPNLLGEIDNSEEIDFKIHQDIAGELCGKEFREINGVSILSDRFIKLLNHIILRFLLSRNLLRIYLEQKGQQKISDLYCFYI